ncbi:MAG: alpha/beta hydrolase [Haliea sp.]|uniref:alpha/beta fold hydrolase n=1 Tax=Haliea sp. TaxID=1932666 RepID=UPI0032EB21FF
MAPHQAQQAPVLATLGMVDVVPRMETAGVQEVIDFMSANPDGFVSIEAAADAVAKYLPHRPRRSSSDGLLKNLRQRSDGRCYWHWDPAVHSSAGSPDSIEAMARRMEEAARLINVPTQVVRGGQSRVVSPEGVAHLAELIHRAGYVDVAAAGHMVAGDQNDEDNAVIREFLVSLFGSA